MQYRIVHKNKNSLPTYTAINVEFPTFSTVQNLLQSGGLADAYVANQAADWMETAGEHSEPLARETAKHYLNL